MELTAAIEALNALTRPCQVILTTDSTYVKDGLTKWLAGWKAKGWKTAAKKPVKNQDLWQALDVAAARHQIDWRWIKGHAGHAENERADDLARRFQEGAMKGRPTPPATSPFPIAPRDPCARQALNYGWRLGRPCPLAW